MKVIGVIPARYKSSRFPGKPLADILGRPMIWWVYRQCLQVPGLDEIYRGLSRLPALHPKPAAENQRPI